MKRPHLYWLLLGAIAAGSIGLFMLLTMKDPTSHTVQMDYSITGSAHQQPTQTGAEPPAQTGIERPPEEAADALAADRRWAEAANQPDRRALLVPTVGVALIGWSLVIGRTSEGHFLRRSGTWVYRGLRALLETAAGVISWGVARKILSDKPEPQSIRGRTSYTDSQHLFKLSGSAQFNYGRMSPVDNQVGCSRGRRFHRQGSCR